MIVPKPRRLKNGKYFIYLRLGDHPISITETTERACIKAAQLAKAEYETGKRTMPKRKDKTTVGQAIDNYIDNRRDILSPSTIRGYNIIRRNRFQELMDTPIMDLTQDDIQRYINRESKHCNAKTLRNAWGLVSKALYVLTDVRYKVDLPQVQRHEKEFLDPDQIDVFTAAVRGTRMEIPALLALCSLRCSEIMGLRWEDVDLKHQCVHVRGATVPDEYNRYVRKDTAKNASSIRTVPIMPQLAAALEQAPHTGEMVVTYTESWLYRAINKLCAANGLPKVGVHGLRHSFASLGYHLGMPEHIVMEIGGWSDETTIRRIYRHVAEADRLKGMNAMQNFYADSENRKLNRKSTEIMG